VTWHTVGTVTVAIATNALAGLALTSHRCVGLGDRRLRGPHDQMNALRLTPGSRPRYFGLLPVS